MSNINKDLGMATAYAYAVSQGYVGTEEEFAALMASYASVAQEAGEARDEAEAARDTAVNAVEGFEDTVVAATDTAVQAVQDKGNEVIGSIPADYTQLNQDVTDVKSDKVPYPINPDSKYGTSGQVLRTKGNGATEWASVGLPTDAQTAQAVSDWLDDHPEATTTVQDHSLTYQKLVNGTLGFVTPEMFGAKGDAITDDSLSLQAMFDHGGICVFSKDKTYAVGSSLKVYSNTFIIGNNALLKATDYIRIIYIPTMNHDIVIEDLNFESLNSFNSSQRSACLEIQRTNANSVEYEDAYNITIRRCSFNKGNSGIIASKATMVIIEDCEFSDFCVQPDISAGGYGILLQSSYRVFIHRCKFFKHRYGRHDVYISELPQEVDYTHNYCKDIHITDCFIDHSEAIRDNPATNPDTASGSTNSISLRNPTNVFIENNYALQVTCFVRTNSTSNPHRACENIVIKNNVIDSPIYASVDTLPSEPRTVFNCAGTADYIGTWEIVGNVFVNCNDRANVMTIMEFRYGKYVVTDNRVNGNGYAISTIYAPCEVMIDGFYSEQYGNNCFEIRAVDNDATYSLKGYMRNIISPNSSVLIKWTADNTNAPLSFFETRELKFTPSSIVSSANLVSIPATVSIESNRYDISMPHVISNTIRMASIIVQDYNNYKTWVRMYDDYGNTIRFYLYNDADSTLNTSAQGKMLLM